jgi:hypothetical protein
VFVRAHYVDVSTLLEILAKFHFAMELFIRSSPVSTLLEILAFFSAG